MKTITNARQLQIIIEGMAYHGVTPSGSAASIDAILIDTDCTHAGMVLTVSIDCTLGNGAMCTMFAMLSVSSVASAERLERALLAPLTGDTDIHHDTMASRAVATIGA